MAIDRPLAGLRVVDVVSGPLAITTRYLAELGARVDRIASPGTRSITAPLPLRRCWQARTSSSRTLGLSSACAIRHRSS
jgi:crotonobetainyl-CoA:carnitine CoA-transferase CaiB-like acyl-CoA transferase